jgi:hypothetical protein
MGNIDRFIRDLDRWQTHNENQQAQREREWQRQREREAREFERIERQAQRDAVEHRKRTRSEQVKHSNAKVQAIYELFTQMQLQVPEDFQLDLEGLLELEEPGIFEEVDFKTVELPPEPPALVPEPAMKLPPEPSGIGRKFQMKAHTKATEAAMANYASERVAWETMCRNLQEEYERQLTLWNDRKDQFAITQASEQAAITASNEEVAQRNENRREELRQLLQGLQGGDVELVQDYVKALMSKIGSIEVLEKPLSSIFRANNVIFDSESGNLIIHMQVLSYEDDGFPKAKSYNYYASSDSVDQRLYTDYERFQMFGTLCTSLALVAGTVIAKAKDLSCINQIEVHVIARVTNPATGNQELTPFVITSASPATFREITLHQAVPYYALQAMGASIDLRFSRPPNY